MNSGPKPVPSPVT